MAVGRIAGDVDARSVAVEILGMAIDEGHGCAALPHDLVDRHLGANLVVDDHRRDAMADEAFRHPHIHVLGQPGIEPVAAMDEDDDRRIRLGGGTDVEPLDQRRP
jgi:hypothetical protein